MSGGLEQIVFDLAWCLGKAGHDVYVLAPDGSNGQDVFKPITPVAPSYSNPEHLMYEAIKPALGDFDIIHAHGWGQNIYLYKAEKPQAHVLQTLHGPTHFMYKPIPKPCFVAASQAHKIWLEAQTDLSLEVVNHGIDLDKYQFCDKKSDYLLYLARVSDEKGALEFVRLCQKTGSKGILAGTDVNTQSGPEYVRRVMAACSASNGLVRYYGEALNGPEKIELLQKARCLVCPVKEPYIEIFGMSSIESLACGTPVLHTQNGAPADNILTGKTGAVVHNWLELEKGLSIALGCLPQACRDRAEEFSREKMAENYLKLYESLFSGKEW